ncbi:MULTISPECIES: hypothetical protein [Rhodobacterales]|jgi:hypothetical protein|uniref:hypothetical protein n=1 Tax=Rhodobacterales TaxID=204455 RepID=UPI00237FD167|nr:hypothetical protein [Phaeobacter gallaeciensis]MDE4099187.1 hypothetical protein [Phaeobacter gallaeciensis]MDE4107947.1 hypothetical protein [Phaeobacter gallaeciensis]MDE4112451.1 hypothetical protein [Phaeobacter gallaeciensis]MDE4116872.1 hypothetical protein [Phaeobacter gallaeciensis]MDE4121394.1 hypothetical protein [Phaeobacter gallaeciensis]
MPKLIQLYIRNVALGFGIAAVFVGLLLWFNVMNLWGLVSTSDVGLLAIGILWFMNGIVFAGVQFAWAVMSLAGDDDAGPRRGTPVVNHFEPIRVKAAAPRPQDRRKQPRD